MTVRMLILGMAISLAWSVGLAAMLGGEPTWLLIIIVGAAFNFGLVATALQIQRTIGTGVP
jgi:hypothetical protein